MTKKNVAALMLAGAMMTVGSGAMAEKYTENQSKTDLGITVTAKADATVDMTLTWSWGDGESNVAPEFNFVWSTAEHKWVPSTAADANAGGNLAFSAKNDGSSNKKVKIENDMATTPTWIALGEMPGETEIPIGGNPTSIGTISVSVDKTAQLDEVAPNPNIGLVVTIGD